MDKQNNNNNNSKLLKKYIQDNKNLKSFNKEDILNTLDTSNVSYEDKAKILYFF